MEQSVAFRNARSFHFQQLVMEYGSNPVPMKILRVFWKLAKRHADEFIKSSAWHGPTSLRL